MSVQLLQGGTKRDCVHFAAIHVLLPRACAEHSHPRTHAYTHAHIHKGRTVQLSATEVHIVTPHRLLPCVWGAMAHRQPQGTGADAAGGGTASLHRP